MIIDCFTFFDEFEILDIRLHELDKWVDRFVLVECAETYSGEKKPLHFDYQKIEPRFRPRLTHLVAPPPENPENQWDRIKSQTDFLMQGLDMRSMPHDLILIGDVDEIPKGRDFTKIKKNQDRTILFIQKPYFFYMNLRRPGGWPGTIMISFANLMKIYKGSMFDARIVRRSGHAVKSGGWHFTKIGDIDSVTLKLRSSGHYDMRTIKKMWQDKEFLRDKMDGSRCIKGRQLFVDTIDEHPKYFLDNLDKFKHMLTEDEKK